MKRALEMAANGYGRAFLAGVLLASGGLGYTVKYIHDQDVARLANTEHNVGVLLVEQGKIATKIDGLIERLNLTDGQIRREIEDIKRRLP